MKSVISARLKLRHHAEQKAALDAVTLAYRDALNFASKKAFEMDNTSSQPKLHEETSPVIREQSGLGFQLACTVEKQAAATYKPQWTNLKRNLNAGAAGHTRRRYKGQGAAPQFVFRTLEDQYGRDCLWKKGQGVSAGTLNGRLVLEDKGDQQHLDLIIVQGTGTGAAKLYDRRGRKPYLLIAALNIELPDQQPADHPTVVGADVGPRYHVVAQSNPGNTTFQAGGRARLKNDRFARAGRTLQRKGARFAARRLIRSEERRGVRNRTEGRSNPKASQKAEAFQRRRNQLSFAELQSCLRDKAPLMGCVPTNIHASHTPQCCPQCGHCSNRNRPNAGLTNCDVCGLKIHVDLAAARNINLRTRLVRQGRTSTGALSMRPDVSYNEVKAADAELRRSTDTRL